jgi:Ca2+ transporting ATPase
MDIDEAQRDKMEKAIETMAGRALRTLCLAYKNMSGSEDLATKDSKNVYDVEIHDLTLLAILGIKDVLRYEVPRAI